VRSSPFHFFPFKHSSLSLPPSLSFFLPPFPSLSLSLSLIHALEQRNRRTGILCVFSCKVPAAWSFPQDSQISLSSRFEYPDGSPFSITLLITSRSALLDRLRDILDQNSDPSVPGPSGPRENNATEAYQLLQELDDAPPSSSPSSDVDSDTEATSDSESDDDRLVPTGFESEEDEGFLLPVHPHGPVHHPGGADEEEDNANNYVGPTTSLCASDILDFPLFPNSPTSLKVFLVTAVNWATKNKLSMVALEEYLRNTAELLPDGHHVPTTIYRLLTTLGISLANFEKHVCVNDCMLFPDVDPSDYENHADEKCDSCEEARFVRRGQTLAPRKKFHYIPLLAQLEVLKQQSGFDTSARKMADQIRTGITCVDSFWGGTLGATFLQQPQALAHFTTRLALSVGLDGVQAFKKEEYDVWPIAVKVWNLHPEERTSKGFTLLTVLIPGSSSPKSFEPYLQPILEEIKNSQTGTPPFSRPKGSPLDNLYCSSRQPVEPVKIFNRHKNLMEAITLQLLTVEEDQDAVPKVTEFMGAAARQNCNKCHNPSVVNPATNRGAYQTGYTDLVAFQAGKKTDTQARAIGASVARGDMERATHGIGPPSVFTATFPAFDIIKGHPIEFFHKLQLVSVPVHARRSPNCW